MSTLTLPMHKAYRTELEKLGIEWTSSAQVKLPKGWTIYKRYEKEFTLIDEKGTPRVAIWMADTVFDKYVRVNFLRPGKELLDREIHLIQSEYDQRVHQFKKEYDIIWNFASRFPHLKLPPKEFLSRHIEDNGESLDIGG